MGEKTRSPDERPPPLIDFVMNQSIFAGFMIELIGAMASVIGLVTCLVRALLMARPLPAGWYYPAIVGFLFGAYLIVAGTALTLLGWLIARWWWGMSLKEFYFGSSNNKADS
jgi:hypothetical protein